MQLLSENKMFGGVQQYWTHESTSTNTQMSFSIYLPPQVEQDKCPVRLRKGPGRVFGSLL